MHSRTTYETILYTTNDKNKEVEKGEGTPTVDCDCE